MSLKERYIYKRYSKLVEKGRLKFFSGEYEEALEFYKKAFQYGYYVEDYNNLGFIYLELNKILLAEDIFKAILDKDDNARSYYGLGCICEATGKNSDALKYYEEAIRVDNTIALVYFDCAYLYDDLDNHEKAKEYYIRSIELENSNFWAHLNLGTIYEKENNYELALKEYLQAYAIDNTQPTVCYNLAIVYTKTGNNDLAILYYEEEVKKTNRYKHAYFNLAILYKDHLKNYEKAKMAYLNGIEDDKEHYLIWYNLGCLYALMNDYKNAYDCFLFIKYKSPKVFKYIREDDELVAFRESDEYNKLVN